MPFWRLFNLFWNTQSQFLNRLLICVICLSMAFCRCWFLERWQKLKELLLCDPLEKTRALDKIKSRYRVPVEFHQPPWDSRSTSLASSFWQLRCETQANLHSCKKCIPILWASISAPHDGPPGISVDTGGVSVCYRYSQHSVTGSTHLRLQASDIEVAESLLIICNPNKELLSEIDYLKVDLSVKALFTETMLFDLALH